MATRRHEEATTKETIVMKKATGMTESKITAEFFETLLNESRIAAGKSLVTVMEIKSIHIDNTVGINGLAFQGDTGLPMIGHYSYEIAWRDKTGDQGLSKIVLKSKAHGRDAKRKRIDIHNKFDPSLGPIYEKLRDNVLDSHTREIDIYRLREPTIQAILPFTFGTLCDEENEIYVLAMENLDNSSHLNYIDHCDKWKTAHISAVLDGISNLHSRFLGNVEQLKNVSGLGDTGKLSFASLHDYASAVIERQAHRLPEIYTSKRVKKLEKILCNFSHSWETLQAAPQTLIHHDFTPRNLCLKQEGANFKLCLYDWEAAWINVPQRDVCEFFCATFSRQSFLDQTKYYFGYYRNQMASLGDKTDDAEFKEIFRCALYHYALIKISYQSVVYSTIRKSEFFPRTIDNVFQLLDSEI
jgi:thiamine kinase-like enzyme